jgi:hypothetical protein
MRTENFRSFARQQSGAMSLTPYGSKANPVDEGCFNSFDIYARENNYSGTFIISKSGGSDYSLPPHRRTKGLWLISPGTICVGGFNAVTIKFTVKDQLGHSASTYVTTF